MKRTNEIERAERLLRRTNQQYDTARQKEAAQEYQFIEFNHAAAHCLLLF